VALSNLYNVTSRRYGSARELLKNIETKEVYNIARRKCGSAKEVLLT
jgi:hypothetical protein